MSRVSFATYCERRTKLGQSWRNDRNDFLGMSPKEQWILHEYYRFAESLKPDQLREHWTGQNTKGSSIAQRAGRAFAAFESSAAQNVQVTPASPAEGRRHKFGKARVGPIVRPQPDTRKVAKTLLEIVRPVGE